MEYLVESEMNLFNKRIEELKPRHCVEELCKNGYGISPLKPRSKFKFSKNFGLCIFGIIHGNETAGLAVLNELLRLIADGAVTLAFPIAVALGNTEAARQGRRFVESDLNRSFGRKGDAKTPEQKRAIELQSILEQSSFFLDLHQTNNRSAFPFFIFPFTDMGYRFARQISLQTVIVTHWGDGFSKDGMCTDEYINTKGGIGITLELGLAGFGAYEIAAGVHAVISALSAVGNLSKQTLINVENDDGIYTWSEVFEFRTGAELVPDLYNFRKLEKGEEFGTVGSEKLICKDGGHVLFAHYPRAKIESSPSELCRIMKKIARKDIPY